MEPGTSDDAVFGAGCCLAEGQIRPQDNGGGGSSGAAAGTGASAAAAAPRAHGGLRAGAMRACVRARVCVCAVTTVTGQQPTAVKSHSEAARLVLQHASRSTLLPVLVRLPVACTLHHGTGLLIAAGLEVARHAMAGVLVQARKQLLHQLRLLLLQVVLLANVLHDVEEAVVGAAQLRGCWGQQGPRAPGWCRCCAAGR